MCIESLNSASLWIFDFNGTLATARTPEEGRACGYQLFKGVVSLLQALTEQGKMLAVATMESRRRLNEALSALKIESYFVTSCCGDEAFAKPHPQMLLNILDYCGVLPEQAVMVGDTCADMQMARNAGTQAVGVCSSFGLNVERMKQSGAQYIVQAAADVFKALKG